MLIPLSLSLLEACVVALWNQRVLKVPYLHAFHFRHAHTHTHISACACMQTHITACTSFVAGMCHGALHALHVNAVRVCLRLAGTPQDYTTATFVQQQFSAAGIPIVEVEQFDVLLSSPQVCCKFFACVLVRACVRVGIARARLSVAIAANALRQCVHCVFLLLQGSRNAENGAIVSMRAGPLSPPGNTCAFNASLMEVC